MTFNQTNENGGNVNNTLSENAQDFLKNGRTITGKMPGMTYRPPVSLYSAIVAGLMAVSSLAVFVDSRTWFHGINLFMWAGIFGMSIPLRRKPPVLMTPGNDRVQPPQTKSPFLCPKCKQEVQCVGQMPTFDGWINTLHCDVCNMTFTKQISAAP